MWHIILFTASIVLLVIGMIYVYNAVKSEELDSSGELARLWLGIILILSVVIVIPPFLMMY